MYLSVSSLALFWRCPERWRRLAVELDSRTFHEGRAAFERDRIRDAVVQLAGYRILRVSYRRLTKDSRGVVADVRALLATPLRVA
jgi:very-short-patch-repair endonuclease